MTAILLGLNSQLKIQTPDLQATNLLFSSLLLSSLELSDTNVYEP